MAMTVPSEAKRSLHSRPWLPAVALATAGLAAYWPSFHGVFVFDDASSIVDNATLRHLWPPWGPLSPPSGGLTVSGRPLVNLSLALNYAAGGLDPLGYHAVNLLIHLLCALALFGVIRRTLAAGALPGPSSRWPAGAGAPTAIAWAAALLWELHPLQTESVAYVVQRAEALMGLLYLLTLYCFIRAATEQRSFPVAERGRRSRLPAGGSGADENAARRRFRYWCGLSWLACLCGMATKEVMVSAPVIVLLYDRTFIAGSFREAWSRRRSIHLGLASTWILLAVLVAAGRGRGGTAGFGQGGLTWAYWASQGPAIVHYLRLVPCPYPLILDYGLRWLQPSWSQLPAVLGVVAFAAAALWAVARRPAAGLLGLWFFAILAPTSLVPGGRQTAAEHRMYLALAPVMALLVSEAWIRTAGPARRWRFFIPVAAVAAVFGILTGLRCGDYRNEVGLWADLVSKRPDDAEALHGLGAAYYRAGRLQEAEAALTKASVLGTDPQTLYTLGRLCADLGRGDEAASHYTAALRLRPAYADAEAAFGNLLKTEGRPGEAATHYRRAIGIEPGNAGFHNDLGVALRLLGQPDEALRECQEAISLDPELAEAHHNMGVALSAAGRNADAVGELALAVRLRPSDAETQYDLGVALATADRLPEAIGHYRMAERLGPNDAATRNNLGAALARSGRMDEAVSEFQAAVALIPGNAAYHRNLARALASAGRAAEAEAELSTAVRLEAGR